MQPHNTSHVTHHQLTTQPHNTGHVTHHQLRTHQTHSTTTQVTSHVTSRHWLHHHIDDAGASPTLLHNYLYTTQHMTLDVSPTKMTPDASPRHRHLPTWPHYHPETTTPTWTQISPQQGRAQIISGREELKILIKRWNSGSLRDLVLQPGG